MFKHWVLNHRTSREAPKFVFEVVKHHRDALSRLVREAVLIQERAALNSRSEWGGYTVGRLTVLKSEKETKKQVELDDMTDKKFKIELKMSLGRLFLLLDLRLNLIQLISVPAKERAKQRCQSQRS